MRYRVSHRTGYSYETPVARSFHALHLRPGPAPRQRLINHAILVEPAPASHDEIVDAFGNPTSILSIEEEHHELIVHARSTVEVVEAEPPDLEATTPWERVAESVCTDTGEIDVDVLQFVCPSRHAPVLEVLRGFAARSFPAGRPVLAGAMDLTTRIYREFQFDAAATDVSTPVTRVLELKRGVCQDFAHLTLATLKTLRVPARYVSGYLLTRPPPGMPKLRGVDASHAWVSVWAPETGWVDFDPTNGLIPREEHISVAFGRDYDDISPISGVLLGGSRQKMSVSVDVEPIAEDARKGA
jgi:transglutaminase-like putative cysteine protease